MSREMKVTTGRELVETERKRLIDNPTTMKDFKEWLGDRTYPLTWMKSQFGETLVEKDGFIHSGGSRFDGHKCEHCEYVPGDDEKFIQFSIYDGEYGDYDLTNICKKCVLKSVELLE